MAVLFDIIILNNFLRCTLNGLGRENRKNDNRETVFTKQTLGVVLILFATLCLVCLITGDGIFYKPGMWASSLLFGCFGYFAYAVVLGTLILGVNLLISRKNKNTKKFKALLTIAFIFASIVVHIATFSDATITFGEYISTSYTRGALGMKTATGGGFFISLVAYWLIQLLSPIGCYAVLSLVSVGCGYLAVKERLNGKIKSPRREFKSSYVKKDDEEEKTVDVEVEGERSYPVLGVVEPEIQKPTASQRLFVANPDDFAVKTKRELQKGKDDLLKVNYSDGHIPVSVAGVQGSILSDEFKKKIEYIKTPANIDLTPKTYGKNSVNTGTTVSNYIPVRPEKPVEEKTQKIEEKEQAIPMFEHDESSKVQAENVQSDTASRAEAFYSKYMDKTEEERTLDSVPEQTFRPLESPSDEIDEVSCEIPEFTKDVEEEIPNTIHDENAEVEVSEVKEELPPSRVTERRARNIFFDDEKTSSIAPEEKPAYTSRVEADDNAMSFGSRRRSVPVEPEKEIEPPKQEEVKKPPVPINRVYNRPPIDLLEKREVSPDAQRENHQERMEAIEKLLAEFHINVIPQNFVQGPSITRYEIMMPPGISVKKVLGYDDDLKMRLESLHSVRIEAPIPGKNLVGIEVANNIKTPVGIREVLEKMNETEKAGALKFAIGKDIVGNSISDNLAKAPHCLVAGATGSGKSVALNVMIISLIMRYSPEDLRLILIDPKRVGFKNYEHLPHLLTDEIITDPQKAVSVFSWAYQEMERRYTLFENCGELISDIDEYNSQIASDTVPKLPKIVIIVDELADLMETCKKEMDQGIRMIAAKSRAAGIHLVLATQRPSVDVITGTIKANLPVRMALKVMNFADSNTILSEGGADKLLGEGDMLYKNSGMPEPARYQGAWISNREITNIVNYIKQNNESYYDETFSEFLENSIKPKQEETSNESGGESAPVSEEDEFFLKALWLAVNSGNVSISQLQRRYRIGYGRAGNIVDAMERLGYISGNEGSKARTVYLTREQFEEKYGPMTDAY